MTIRETPWEDGTPCWMDLMVADPGAAAEFYASLFGWDAPEGPPEFGGYRMATIDGEAVAGIAATPAEMEGMPSVWSVYLASADAEATAGKIKAAGGTVLMEPFDVGPVGRMLMASDPSGAVFGVWQAGEHIGATRVNEPGAMVWNECLSRDFPAARSFYAEVMGYGFEDFPADPGDPDAAAYAALLVDGRMVGGIGEMNPNAPAEMPSYWGGYFSCADCDETVSRVTELGGTLLRPPVDSPYGRMAMLQGAQGEYFSVIGDTATPAVETPA